MKASEVREMSSEEIAQRIKDEKDQLSHLKFQHAVAELPNPIVIRQKRRLIARLSGILNERSAAE
ncbi:MAG: 50S ribosomal protein L29 [Rhodothermales bacterium]|nr:50S ribosomal protein L29 [Rhodothermales bacterium]MBO6781415.1 50S ribosomal protein L29 [Rhodothermales bacterium]